MDGIKAIYDMTNEEKAMLLHALFPDELADLLDYIYDFGNHLLSNIRFYELQSNEIDFPFHRWLKLSTEANKQILENRSAMMVNKLVFSSLLYADPISVYVNYCTINYAKNESINLRFNLMVQMLFMFDELTPAISLQQ